jgi:hypothetical protein
VGGCPIVAGSDSEAWDQKFVVSQLLIGSWRKETDTALAVEVMNRPPYHGQPFIFYAGINSKTFFTLSVEQEGIGRLSEVHLLFCVAIADDCRGKVSPIFFISLGEGNCLHAHHAGRPF